MSNNRLMEKYSYFQGGGGVNEPTPGKKKYKSDKAIVVQPRFKEPFYRNYDLYNTEGVDGPPKHGPGAGWHDMDKYKSISEFRKDKHKKLYEKYKADDSWIEDDGSLSKKENNSSKRAALLSKILKTAIDFPIDDQIGSAPILDDSGTYSASTGIGGATDEYLTLHDNDGNSPDRLYFGHDSINELAPEYKNADLDKINDLLNVYLNSEYEKPPFGLPDGLPEEESLNDLGDENPQYGTTESGNTLYDKM